MYSLHGGSFWSRIAPVTKNLIIINIIVWAFMAIAPDRMTNLLTKYCALHYITSPDFNVAQLVTYMFMHDPRGLAHVFFNMFALLMFGSLIESALGSKRYLFYYLTCGIGAALIQEGAWAMTIDSLMYNMVHVPYEIIRELHPEVLNILMTIGASGAVYGILLAFGMLFPNRELFLFFIPVPIKAKWMVIGYGVMELMIGMSNANDGVAHFAHLGGMLFGLLLILYWRKKGIINGHYY